MSEHMMPIPSRLYNAAVGGHVCGPEDVDFGQKVVHLVKYDKDGNEVSFESQVTQTNKIYVIHDDFTLSSNITIPANCTLQFDGGSISGTYKLDFNNAALLGNPNIACDFKGDIKNDVIYLKWFTSSDEILVKLNKVLQSVYPSTTNNNKKIVIPNGTYEITVPIEIRYNNGIDIDFSGAELIDKVDVVHPLTHL